MSQINTNVGSLIAQRVLSQQNKSLSQSLERLSTGLSINRGSDNPSGLIASEKFRSDKAQINAALSNAERANQVVNTAEGGLNEVQSLLTEVQSLVSSTANTTGLSQQEKDANQLQVDQILQTIDRISSVTSFGGTKLLNGSLDFTVSGVNTKVASNTINGAQFAQGGSLAVNAVVTASAQHAGVFLSTNGPLDLSASTATFVIDIAGAKGTRQLSFASGSTTTNIVAAVNQFTDVTGISASTTGTGVFLKSTEYGSDQFVSVDVVDAAGIVGAGAGIYSLSATNEATIKTTGATSFAATTAPIRDSGQDVAALVNGIKARGQGTKISVSTSGLDASFNLTSAGATATGGIALLTITGGGAGFNLGPTVDTNNTVRLGIGSVAARNLGSNSNGFLNSLQSGGTNDLNSTNLGTSQKIVNDAISQVASLRGRLGSFQTNVVGSTINSLNVSFENISSAESAIRDTDFAKETSQLTRSQILVSAAQNTLAINNSRPQSVLGLLR